MYLCCIIRALEGIVAFVTMATKWLPLYSLCKRYFSDMFSFSKVWSFDGNASLVLYLVILRLHLCAKK